MGYKKDSEIKWLTSEASWFFLLLCCAEIRCNHTYFLIFQNFFGDEKTLIFFHSGMMSHLRWAFIYMMGQNLQNWVPKVFDQQSVCYDLLKILSINIKKLFTGQSYRTRVLCSFVPLFWLWWWNKEFKNIFMNKLN